MLKMVRNIYSTAPVFSSKLYGIRSYKSKKM